MFVKHGVQGQPSQILAEVVRDFLIAGTEDECSSFNTFIWDNFKVGRFSFKKEIFFYRLQILIKQDGFTVINMQEYMDKIQPIKIRRQRQKQGSIRFSGSEVTWNHALTSALNFLCRRALPQALFVARVPYQNVPRMKVKYLQSANKTLAEIHKLSFILK